MKNKVDKWIDEALRSDIDCTLRNDFRDKVMKAIKRREKTSQRRLYFWMILGISAIIGCGLFISRVFAPALFQGLENFDHIVPIAIVMGLAITLIQYLDKVLIKNRLLSS